MTRRVILAGATWQADTPTLGDKLRVMRALVLAGADAPAVQLIARAAVSGVRPSAGRDGLALALAEWTRRTLVYTRERGEVMCSALVSIQAGAGDCDDHAIALATLATALAIPAELRTAGPQGRAAHVWTALFFPRARLWLDCDTTIREPIGALRMPRGWRRAERLAI